MSLIADLAAIVAPVFLVSAFGYGWARSGRAYDVGFVTRLVTGLGTPCLIFATLTKVRLDGAAVMATALATVVVLAVFAVCGFLLLRLFRLPLPSYLPALMFPNSGNMGLPLSFFAFGERGLALSIICFAVFAVAHFTIGIALASGRMSFRQMFQTPLLYAVFAAVIVMVLDVPVPRWAANTLTLLGQLTIPMMLLTLGASLAGLRPQRLKRVTLLSLARLGLGAAGGVGVAWLLIPDPVARAVFILQCAMPVAVFNYLFASLYERDPEEVAAIVLVSTLLSFASMPVLLGMLL